MGAGGRKTAVPGADGKPNNEVIELDDKRTIKEILGHNGDPMQEVVRMNTNNPSYNIDNGLDDL